MQRLNIDCKLFKNSDFQALCEILSPYTKRAYLVGGGVRDLLLGREIYDYDVEIYDICPENFSNLMQKIGAVGVGKSFFVYKWGKFDLSIPRTESKTSFGHTGFSVSYCNDERLASTRRDFTINSIMLNIFNGKILDFHNGINDLKNKILRVVNERSFQEDSLRLFRGIQFVARFGLKIDKKSFKIMKNIDVLDLSKERIRLELEKLFLAKYQHFGVELIAKFGLDKLLFGVKFEKKDIANLTKNIKNHSKFVKDDRLFLYEILNYFKLDYGFLERNLVLTKHYKKLKSEPYFKKASNLDIVKTALKFPLKEWLGLNSYKRVKFAKKLAIYDENFKAKIDREKIIKNTSEKSKIKQELESAEISFILQFLKELKA